ncbi:pilus assembly protein TadG-related protein [Botrimarina mediterranea]|uniref:pilus assembly protein TadG-related protein n=1 Tax=Botrimarina mediterranea TaxID=2528022 RepID=UPI00118CC809|nr:hypothetical protein K2D_38650 [Planctomycetes bacterium K2D]
MPQLYSARRRKLRHTGKLLVMLAILLPMMLSVAGLVIDGGLLMSKRRDMQHGADAAATAAAFELLRGNGVAAATGVATEVLQIDNDLPDATVTVNIPPTDGAFAGRPNHVEVIAQTNYRSRLMGILDGLVDYPVQARAVAGVQDVTAGAAIIVLDPDPAPLQINSVAQTLAGIDLAALTTEAVGQSGLTPFLFSVPIVGPLASSLLNSQLTSVMPIEIGSLLDDALAGLPGLNAPAIIAGLEVEGVGTLVVDGAVIVNNQWGGVDENNEIVGDCAGPPYGVSCMPIVPTTSVVARDVRVAGGVDELHHYGPFGGGDGTPLQANRLPVEDPLEGLPTPSISSDAANVSATVHNPGHLVRVTLPIDVASEVLGTVRNLLPALLRSLLDPLLDPLTELLTEATIQPGVYSSITVLAPLGGVHFQPGVYIVRGGSPITGTALTVIGPVQAEGVLFYVTASADYNATSGLPDAGQVSTEPPPNTIGSVLPSVLLLPLLPGADLTGLNDPSSPFHGMLLYQQRRDRRPIVVDLQQIVGGSRVSGTIYGKWAHLLLVGGGGSHDLRFVSGTARVVTVTNTMLAPSELFPPAQDVLLLE